MDRVEFARRILNTHAPIWNNGQPLFIALDHMSDAQLRQLVEDAATDYRLHNYLRAWLAGELGQAVPDALPEALTPFVRRLAAGTGPDGRGQKKPAPSKALLRHCAEALKEEYGCAIYSDKLDGTACDYIGKALGLTPETIRRRL